ncbi:MAG: hypothetical protein Fur0011_6210 [Candidatus Microgenomates bacterium]
MLEIRSNWHLFTLSTIYLLYVIIFRGYILSHRFNEDLTRQFYLSQDIPYEVAGNRLFLSDQDIYAATGVLYFRGGDPAFENFEHPPLGKYFFGLSTLLTQNPLVIQLIWGFLLLLYTAKLATNITHNRLFGLLASIGLLVDPLFQDVLGVTLLDMGQSALLVIYLFYFTKNPRSVGSGIILGLLASFKFPAAAIFIVGIITLRYLLAKQLSWWYFKHLLLAFFIFTLSYIQAFVIRDGFFNIIWHVLRMGKFFVDHSTASFFGASAVLFTTGWWKTWWGDYTWIRTNLWTPLWPLGLAMGIVQRSFWGIIPVAYLLYLGVQAPFPRYFMIAIPFVYIALTISLYNLMNRYHLVPKSLS